MQVGALKWQCNQGLPFPILCFCEGFRVDALLPDFICRKFCVLIDAFRALLKLQTLFVRGRGSFHLNPIHVEDIEHKHYYIHPKLCVFLFMPQRLRTTGVSLQVIRVAFCSRRSRCPPWNWTSTHARKWSSSSGSATAKTPTSSPSRLTGSGIFPVVQ